MKGLIAGLLALMALGLLFFFYTAEKAPSAEMTEAEIAQIEAEVRQEIIDRLDVYQEAVMNGDLETVASVWASDARIINPGMDLAGDELHAFIAEVFPSLTVTDVGDELQELFVHGDAAYGIYRYWDTVQEGDQEPVAFDYHCFIRWEKEDGVWKIDRDVCGPVDAPAEG